MKLALMQPYLFPYAGYFQLVSAVDRFVFFDTANFIKQGWIHRNRLRLGRRLKWFTVPLQRPSSHRRIVDLRVNPEHYPGWRAKFLRTLREQIIGGPDRDLLNEWVGKVLPRNPGEIASIGELAARSVTMTWDLLGLTADFDFSSRHGEITERGQDRVIKTCQRLDATVYINPCSGRHLYDQESFRARGLRLRFLDPDLPPEYSECSILDVLAHGGIDNTRDLVRRVQLSVPSFEAPVGR